MTDRGQEEATKKDKKVNTMMCVPSPKKLRKEHSCKSREP